MIQFDPCSPKRSEESARKIKYSMMQLDPKSSIINIKADTFEIWWKVQLKLDLQQQINKIQPWHMREELVSIRMQYVTVITW